MPPPTTCIKPPPPPPLQVELLVAVHVGKSFKARNTKLEGDSFEFITAYDTLVHMGETVKNPITAELTAELKNVATSATTAPASLFATLAPKLPVAPATPVTPLAPAISATTNDGGTVLEILKSLTPAVFKTANLCVDSSFWKWDQAPPQPSFSGKPTSWVSTADGKEELRVRWQVQRDPDGQQVLDAKGKPKYEASVQSAIVAELMQHNLRLEPFDNAAPPPTLSAVPALAESDTHLLSSSNLSDMNVLLAHARAIVSPAAVYFEKTIEGKRGGQLARMKAVRFFNPLHVLSSGEVTETDIEGLSVLRMFEHPKLKPKIEVPLQPHTA